MRHITRIKEHALNLSLEEKTTDPSDFESYRLLGWLEESIRKLFDQVGLPTSLGQAGLSLADIN